MPQLSGPAQRLPSSGIRRIFEMSTQLDDVIQLSVGEPGLPVAPHILAAGERGWATGDTKYTPNSGARALRDAIRFKLKRHNSLDVADEQIHVTAGGSQALHLAMNLALSPGDEVLIPNPGYPTFAMAPALVGATAVPYELSVETGFVPLRASLERRVTPRTRALLINSPSNPLGVVYTAVQLRDLVEFAEKHDLWIISDEVYDELTFGSTHVSVAGLGAAERTLSVFSLSKTYGLTGGRVGYLVAPAGLALTIRAAQEATVSCVNSPAQLAAAAALTGDQSSVEAAKLHYSSNVAAAAELLDEFAITYQRPRGAMYLWIDVSQVSGGNVAAWAEQFLLTQKVAVAPGSAFGTAGEGWIRLCIAGEQSPLLTGIGRLPRL